MCVVCKQHTDTCVHLYGSNTTTSNFATVIGGVKVNNRDTLHLGQMIHSGCAPHTHTHTSMHSIRTHTTQSHTHTTHTHTHTTPTVHAHNAWVNNIHTHSPTHNHTNTHRIAYVASTASSVGAGNGGVSRVFLGATTVKPFLFGEDLDRARCVCVCVCVVCVCVCVNKQTINQNNSNQQTHRITGASLSAMSSICRCRLLMSASTLTNATLSSRR